MMLCGPGNPGAHWLRSHTPCPTTRARIWPSFYEGDSSSPVKNPSPRAGGVGRRQTQLNPALFSVSAEGGLSALKTGLKMAWLYLSYLLYTESLEPCGRFSGRIFLANPPLLALILTLQYEPHLGDWRGITDPQSFSMCEKNVFLNQILHKPVFKNNQSANPS